MQVDTGVAQVIAWVTVSVDLKFGGFLYGYWFQSSVDENPGRIDDLKAFFN